MSTSVRVSIGSCRARLRLPKSAGVPPLAFALTWATALLCTTSLALAGPQTKEQQRCIDAVNKRAGKVAAAQGKLDAGCIRSKGLGRLGSQTVDECFALDARGKVAKAKQKLLADEAKRCTSPPPSFAYTGGAIANDAAERETIGTSTDVFGDPADDAITAGAAKCQSALSKSWEKLAATRFKQFRSCKRNGLAAGAIVDAQGVAACLTDDPKDQIARAREKVVRAAEKRCGGLVIDTAFPGLCAGQAATPTELGQCVAAAAECRMCRAANEIDGLSASCDDIDDGALNGSCPQCGNGVIEAGEECDDGIANSDTAADACRTTCVAARCGDSVIDTTEQCDDGGDSASCDGDCTAAACGDSYTNSVAGEECDDGAQSPNCEQDCSFVVCGDGTVNPSAGEGCDDGNTTPGDGCNARCGCEFGVTGPFCQEPLCPDVSRFVLHAHVTGQFCLTDNDCDVGSCNLTLNRCVTATDLDTGWTGLGHDADVNDAALASYSLHCSGPYDGGSAEPCGECFVTGVRPDEGSCRCIDDNRSVCDEPFEADDDDCGGSLCTCYVGPPLPVSAGNTPACVVNRLANDVFGTTNVDTGASRLDVNLRAVAYLGERLVEPCPYCSGDPVAMDGVRGGVCVHGPNDGQSCDVDARNETFPGPGGDGHSLDCFPTLGKNVSGQGLKIDLRPTTGQVSLSDGVECGFSFAPESCPCGVCSDNAQIACNSNADCGTAGACERVAEGNPRSNQCTGGLCTDLGNGQGECTDGPDTMFCDGVVRSNGEPYVTCTSDASCQQSDCNGSCGLCTLSRRRTCFPETITATGAADTEAPVAVAAFCIPPTASPGINSVTGLPGPARVVNQNSVQSLCASSASTDYVPGVGGCPPASSTTTSTSTTSTTLPCGGSVPLCNGGCPLGQTCELDVMSASCTCTP